MRLTDTSNMCAAANVNVINVDYKDLTNTELTVVDFLEGQTELRFNLPQDDSLSRYMYRIWDQAKEEEPDYMELENTVFMRRDQSYLWLTVTLPYSGTFELHLFVRNSGKDGTEEEDKLFRCCAQIQLVCKQAMDNWKPYLCNPRQEWGPGQDSSKLGLVPLTNVHGILISENGRAEMAFRTEKPVQLIAELRSHKYKKEELTRCLVHREENNEAVIYVKLASPGYYALDVYGRYKSRKPKSCTYPYLFSYLINVVNAAPDKVMYPDIINQRCGPTDENHKLNLTPVSHPESYFKTTKGSIKVDMTVSQPAHFLSEMHLLKENNMQQIEDHMFATQEKEKVTFNIRFPQSGHYLISLYGKLRISACQCACLYHYVVEVFKGMKHCRPYPKTYSHWGEGCTVEGLDDGVIPCGEVVPVAVTIPEAKYVAVIGDEWSYLYQFEEDDNQWKGNVKTGPAGGELKLSACYQEDCKYFLPLMELKVKTRKELPFLEEIDSVVIKLKKDKIQKNQERLKRREQDIAKVKMDLQEGIDLRDIILLEEAIRYVNRRNYKYLIKELYSSAKNVLKSLQHIEELSASVIEMTPSIMAEVRSYQSPKSIVHKVVVATFLLLGEDEEATKDWKRCQTLCNSIDLKQRLQKFHLDKLHPEIAARAYELLKRYTIEDAKASSITTSAFYLWVMGMVEEVNLRKKGSVHNTTAASIKRQKSIFNMTEKPS